MTNLNGCARPSERRCSTQAEPGYANAIDRYLSKLGAIAMTGAFGVALAGGERMLTSSQSKRPPICQ